MSNAPHILVIDDEPQILRAMRAILTEKQFKVTTASRGEEGLTLAAANEPDIVILDLGLPDMDGVALALESARLLEEAQKRATRESFLSEVAAKLSTSFQLDSILRDTVAELGQTLEGATISFQLIDPSKPPKPDPSADRENME